MKLIPAVICGSAMDFKAYSIPKTKTSEDKIDYSQFSGNNIENK